MRPRPTFSPSLVSSSVQREASERLTQEFKFHTFLSVCGIWLVCAGTRVSGLVKQGRVSGVLLLALSACSFEVGSLPEHGLMFPSWAGVRKPQWPWLHAPVLGHWTVGPHLTQMCKGLNLGLHGCAASTLTISYHSSPRIEHFKRIAQGIHFTKQNITGYINIPYSS